VNSTDRDLVFSSNTFLGIGRLGQISAIQEASDLRPTGIQMALSGIPSAYVSMVLSEQYQGRTVKVWLGFLDAPTGEGGGVGGELGYGQGPYGQGPYGGPGDPPTPYTLIADPMLVFQGLIDQMSITMGETATISLTAENRLIRWERPNVRRWTNEDQQKAFPGDKGLEFVAQTAEKEILWGRNGGAASGGGTGGLPPGLKK
jgi:hypothetical protein